MHALHPVQRIARIDGPILATAVLLAVCVGLAAGLVWTRGLGDPVRLDGWSITFRPPPGWRADPGQADGSGTSVVYRELDDRRGGRELRISRLGNRNRLSAAQICRVLVTSRQGLGVGFFQRPTGVVEPWPLGNLPGARAVVQSGESYLHVGTLTRDDGTAEAYIFEFRSATPLDQRDLSLCDALARSVQTAD